MLLAAIGGIHGDCRALEKVLAAIDAEGIETILNTGSCVLGGDEPNEVVALLRERAIPTVQGLPDRQVVRFLKNSTTLKRKCSGDEYAQIERTFYACHTEVIEYLRDLPKLLHLELESVKIVLCSGAPSGPKQILLADDPESRFRREREIAPVDLIVLGDTGEPFQRQVSGTLFVNPGNLCMSCPSSHPASYALIDTDVTPYRCEFVAL